MARYDDLDTKTIALSAIVSSIVLFLLILGGRAMSYAWQNSAEDARRETSKYAVSDAEIAAQKELLKKSGKVEDPPAQEGGSPVVRDVLPIDQALRLVAEELSSKPGT